jgi:CheY-like chemotaxis protein
MNANAIEVLLVEDSSDDYEIIRSVLDDNRIRYHHVRDGLEALRYILSAVEGPNSLKKLHLVLLDLKLHKLNGLEVLKRIRSDPKTHNIPVVILSSTDDAREILQAYDLGASSFAIKPIEFEKFVRMLNSIFNYWVQVNERSG